MIATSFADPIPSATATLTLSAKFAFSQELLAGEFLPFSMTPIFGTFGADGKFTATNLIDPGTGKPPDTSV